MLLGVEIFVAFWAFAGGIGLMGGGLDLSKDWLDGTPFDDYFIPGLILFVVVGGSTLAALLAVWRRNRFAGPASVVVGSILLIWIIVQVALIGYRSWMQPTFFVAGLVVVALSIPLARYFLARRGR
jgi:energy-converting hydrogenase Eha subunit B